MVTSLMSNLCDLTLCKKCYIYIYIYIYIEREREREREGKRERERAKHSYTVIALQACFVRLEASLFRSFIHTAAHLFFYHKHYVNLHTCWCLGAKLIVLL